jgi:hypothetical protein
MKKKIFGFSALLVAVVCSFAFNRPATLKDVECGQGKFWYVYDQSTPVVEDSNNPSQLASARTAGNYSRLESLLDCNGSVVLCAICAAPDASDASIPTIPSGSDAYIQLGNYVNNQPFSNQFVIEKPE